MRPLTKTPSDTIEVMREIEDAAKLKFTGIINNSNLGVDTTPEDIAASLPYIQKISELTSLPCIAVTLHNRASADKLSKEHPEFNFVVIPDSTKKLF